MRPPLCSGGSQCPQGRGMRAVTDVSLVRIPAPFPEQLPPWRAMTDGDVAFLARGQPKNFYIVFLLSFTRKRLSSTFVGFGSGSGHLLR